MRINGAVFCANYIGAAARRWEMPPLIRGADHLRRTAAAFLDGAHNARGEPGWP